MNTEGSRDVEEVSSDTNEGNESGDTMSEPDVDDNIINTNKSDKSKGKKLKSATLEKKAASGTGKRRRSSKYWEHFTDIPDSNHCSCNYCGAKIGCTSKNVTGPLKNHNERCKKSPTNIDLKQKMIQLESLSEGSRLGEGNDSAASNSCVPTLWKFNQAVCRAALARMIIVDELPFAFVEHEGFRSFCKALNPAFYIPSRTTMTRDCYTFYIHEKLKLRDSLSKLSSRVSLTTDAWTSGQNLSYMCLTLHFINDEWVLHKRIINFCPLAGHSGALIGRGVEKCLIDWGIKKILTVDNASSNDVAVDLLRRTINHWNTDIMGGKYFHMRCVAHILNLVVRDGLKYMDTSIARVHALVRYVRSSPARLQKFKHCVKEENIESKGLVCLDVDTRWNSTYLMLVSAVKFKRAFDNLIMKDSSVQREMSKVVGAVPGNATDEDWERVNQFLPVLKFFYHGTLTLLGSRDVTSNVCVRQIFAIGMSIKALCINEDEGIKAMATRMKLKYDKYWGDINKINYLLFVAVLLDPRCKMRIVDWIFKECYDPTKCSLLSLNVKVLIDDLFKLYSAAHAPKVQKKTTTAAPSSSNLMSGEFVLGEENIMDFDMLLTSSYQSDAGYDISELNKTELENYLEERLEISSNKKFDILKWWRDNQRRYPILAKLARDVLAMPVTTVASESAFSTAFSTGGRVVDAFRTSLTSKMVEALVCTQDWERKSNSPVVIEENLLALEELEEEMRDLCLQHPNFILDENYYE